MLYIDILYYVNKIWHKIMEFYFFDRYMDVYYIKNDIYLYIDIHMYMKSTKYKTIDGCMIW